MRPMILSVPLLVALSAAALSQPIPNGARPGNNGAAGMPMPRGSSASNLTPEDTHSITAPDLPAPDLPDSHRPSDLLRAAEGALAAGRTGQTQESLEMAQTRLLDRSVPLGRTHTVSDNPTVGQISQALQALASHDRGTCMQFIQAALGSAAAQGL
ncbi:hypothetical protein [Rhodopila sp.]|uniref:hypothetical protein n=1 Tax=Rhodopila sp. TaxID=2480087 RepID=UPI003D1413FF